MVGLTSEKSYNGAALGKKDGYGLKTDGKILSLEHPSGIEWSHSRCWGGHEDIVGCGFIPSTCEIFFTQNGSFCGVAFRASPQVAISIKWKYYSLVDIGNRFDTRDNPRRTGPGQG